MQIIKLEALTSSASTVQRQPERCGFKFHINL